MLLAQPGVFSGKDSSISLAIPFFFRLASNEFPDIESVGRIEKKT